MYDIEKVKILEEFLTNKSIVDILDEWGIYYESSSQYGPIDLDKLKESGMQLIYSCPFHPEKKPSFSVQVEANICHCFSCGKGGGSAKLIDEYYKMNYDTKLYYASLEKYLQLHPEICNELGFTSMQTFNFNISKISLQDIIRNMDKKLLSDNRKVEEVVIKIKPNKIDKNITEILKYMTSIQMGYNQ